MAGRSGKIGEANAGDENGRWNGSDCFGFSACNSFCLRSWRATSPSGICGVSEFASKLAGGFCVGAGEQLFFCAHSSRLASTCARCSAVRMLGCLRSSSV